MWRCPEHAIAGNERQIALRVGTRWTWIHAREKSVGRDGEPVVDEPGQPIVIRPITALEPWPEGDIDLRGRAW